MNSFIAFLDRIIASLMNIRNQHAPAGAPPPPVTPAAATPTSTTATGTTAAPTPTTGSTASGRSILGNIFAGGFGLALGAVLIFILNVLLLMLPAAIVANLVPGFGWTAFFVLIGLVMVASPIVFKTVSWVYTVAAAVLGAYILLTVIVGVNSVRIFRASHQEADVTKYINLGSSQFYNSKLQMVGPADLPKDLDGDGWVAALATGEENGMYQKVIIEDKKDFHGPNAKILYVLPSALKTPSDLPSPGAKDLHIASSRAEADREGKVTGTFTTRNNVVPVTAVMNLNGVDISPVGGVISTTTNFLVENLKPGDYAYYFRVKDQHGKVIQTETNRLNVPPADGSKPSAYTIPRSHTSRLEVTRQTLVLKNLTPFTYHRLVYMERLGIGGDPYPIVRVELRRKGKLEMFGPPGDQKPYIELKACPDYYKNVAEVETACPNSWINRIAKDDELSFFPIPSNNAPLILDNREHGGHF